MCGIIGYTGKENALPILLEGLHSLEYRGYDSAGISVFGKGGIATVKAKGRIHILEEIIKEHKDFDSLSASRCGIGHTRWATHGEPSDTNSHPHSTPRMSLVHNGIIENHAELSEKLKKEGYTFESQTDTEAALKVIDSYYVQYGDPFKAIAMALSEIRGSYAFGMLFDRFPGMIFGVKKESPLLCARGEGGSFLASDIPAFLSHTDRYYRLEEGEVAVLSGDSVRFFDLRGNFIEKTPEKVDWTYEQATKGGFAHFMLKEIYEEPEAIESTLAGRLSSGRIDFGIEELDRRISGGFRRIHIVACGTAMHAGLIGKVFLEKLARIPVEVEIASEFRYKDPLLYKDDLFIALSQSGETADTLAALRLAKEKGLYTLGIVNVVGSSLAREADGVIYTHAGPEIAVASTKAYSVQICILYLLALRIAEAAGTISSGEAGERLSLLVKDAPQKIRKVLESCEDIKRICTSFRDKNSLFFLGRGADYALACEASLKLKEVSYIHCEAYAAGELKHGTISLITEGTDVVAIATEKHLFPKTLGNIREVRARGARVTLIADETLEVSPDVYDEIIRIPPIEDALSCLPAAAAFQMIAYCTAVLRGCDVDKPRNLAKSVTVE